MTRTARLSEDALIARFFAPLAGPGALGLRDDAAILVPPSGQDIVLTKDMLVAGVHFFADDPPDAIARKALRVNLSDLAAKGAEPLGFLLGLALPADWQESRLAGFAAGLRDDAAAFGLPLFGGDTVKTPGPLCVSVTAFGCVPHGRMVPRDGAQPGDLVYVSGTIGDAALGLAVRQATPWTRRLTQEHGAFLSDRYLLPQPRLGLRDALRAHARAAMDISDGLAGDLAKMLRLVSATATIEVSRVPLSPAARAATAVEANALETALTGGDDYEILCAVDPAEAAAFEALAPVPVTMIGRVLAGDGPPMFRTATGTTLDFANASFQHF